MATTLQAPISAVIFDLDGTLTMPFALDFSNIRKEYNIQVGHDLLEAVHALEDVTLRTLAMASIEAEEHKGRNVMVVRPHVIELIRNCQEKNIKMALATRNTMTSIHSFLSLTGLHADVFSTIWTRDSMFRKPNGQVATTICNDVFEMHVSNVLFVGDSTDDLYCAQSAGCQTCIVDTTANAHLSDLCDYFVQDMIQLGNIVHQNNAVSCPTNLSGH